MKNKTTPWIIVYTFFHLIITGFSVFLASISPLAEIYGDTEWIRYYAVIIAFVILLLDYFFYDSITKRIIVKKIFICIIRLIDIVVFIFSALEFIMINAIYIYLSSASLQQVTHWVWAVTFAILMVCFVFLAKKRKNAL